jgi:hypothetical protein
MKDVNGSHTCKENFRVDAKKEYDWDASVAIKPNQSSAPNKDSKLVAQLDMILSALVHINQLIFQTFFLNLSQLFFHFTFLHFIFFFLTHFSFFLN